MIKVNVKVSGKGALQFKKFKDQIIKVKDGFFRDMSNVIPKMILEDLSNGVSPVANHTFKTYANSYKNQIRKYYRNKFISPVTLKLSGDMYKSIKIIKGSNLNSLMGIIFESDIAYYHTVTGIKRKGGNVIRKILPVKNGEKFNTEITMKIRDNIFKQLKV